MAIEPHGQLLRERGTREGEGTCTESADEKLCGDALAGVLIDERNTVAEIDKALLPGPVRLTQPHREAFLEAPVQLSKLRILVTAGVFAFVLLPGVSEILCV